MEAVVDKSNVNKANLPRGWKWVRLGDVCLKVESIKRANQNPQSEFLYLDIGGIDNTKNVIHEHKVYYWKDAPSRAQQIVEMSDILFSTVRIYMRNIAMIDKEIYIKQIASSGFCVIRANKELVDAKFIFHLALSNQFLQPLNELQTGSSYPAVRDKDVFSQLVPLPPLPEQHAIVSKIEELLSELDRGKQQLELAQQQLKVYRQAVLKWAFEGKFTGGKKGWSQTRLGDLANAIDPQPSHRTPPLVHEGIPFVSIKDFDSELDKIDFTKARLVSSNVLKEHLNRYQLKQGDFVIGKIGTIGKPVRIVLPQNYALSANIVLIQPRKIDATFLYYFFQSSIMAKAFLAGTRATTQAAFGIQKVRELEIQIPPPNEQQIIVQEIESRLSVCDKVEETINQSLAQTETLRQSILKKAFEGKLLVEVENKNIRAIAAEQLTKNNVQTETHFPKIIAGIKDTDLHAGILAMVIDVHEKSPEHHMKLSHVKGEKIAHLVEAYVGIDLGRTPRKDAAGPDDYPHLKKVESRAAKAGWFRTEKLRIGQTYVSKSGMPKIIKRVKETLSTEDVNKIEKLIQTFLPFELEHAEVIATVYAGWNNLLLVGKTPTDEEIVFESRENWSKRKLSIERQVFFKSLEWMRRNQLIPVGKGKFVKSK